MADFGILLTTAEITRQYDRYNASEALDGGTQEVLGAVLDAIELRSSLQIPAQQSAVPTSDRETLPEPAPET